MMVVEKIEKTSDTHFVSIEHKESQVYHVDTNGDVIGDTKLYEMNTKIEAVYNACVEYIKQK